MLLKKIFWFWWRKTGQKSDSEFLSYNLMLNSGEKKNILTRGVRKKISEQNKKTYPPPCKLNGRSLKSEKAAPCKLNGRSLKSEKAENYGHWGL
jgi:hypothetical protein